MTFFLPRKLQSGQKLRHGVSLGISLMFMGWVMALYHLPLWAWVLTVLNLIYLSKIGRGAIPISMTWITLIIWFAAYKYAAPAGFMWRNAKYWAASLIVLWVVAVVVVLALAQVPSLYRQKSRSVIMSVMPEILMICGLGCGVALYHHGISPQ